MNGSIPQYDNNSFKSVYNGHLISSLILLSLPTHNHTRFFFLLITFPDVLICVRDCASLSSALTVSLHSRSLLQCKTNFRFHSAIYIIIIEKMCSRWACSAATLFYDLGNFLIPKNAPWMCIFNRSREMMGNICMYIIKSAFYGYDDS